MKKADR